MPEDPRDPEGTQIELRTVVIPARESTHPDPVVLLAGGPGQGAVDAYRPLLGAFELLGRERDLVLVDQRGTGESNPLRCPPAAGDLLENLSIDVDVERIVQCREALHADPSLYGTPEAIADLEALRIELGYPSLNLIGGSYGTRVALAYARAYPESTRTVVLDGSAPVDMRLPLSFARDAQEALDRVVQDCAAAPGCAESFPDLRGSIDDVLERAEQRPVVTLHDPRTGEPTELTLDREMVGAGMRAMLYSPDLTALLPLAVTQALQGHWAPLLSGVLTVADRAERTMSEGLHLSVVCSEDVPFIEDEDVRRETKGSFMGDAIVSSMRQSCRHWPVEPVAAAFREPVRTDLPVLLLSGRLDPATPPRWGEAVARHLGKARHIVVPSAAHGTFGVPCMSEVLDEFIDTADPSAVDEGCVVAVPAPAFFIDPAGPSVERSG